MARSTMKNNSENGWVVQKFGGTSVGKFPDKIAEDIVQPYLRNNKLVVVCSARSSGKKVTGTTSRLLEVFRRLKSLEISIEPTQTELIDEARRIIQDICDDHVAAAEKFVRDASRCAMLIKDIQDECLELCEYIVAAKRFHLEVNARSKDRVASFGEKLSCRFMACLLEDRNVEAQYVDLSDALSYEGARRLDHTFYSDAAAVIRKKILACGDKVPIVTGFFGNVPGSLLDGDIGRGYTDLCAALIAVGLKAGELQVWKEVDGIFTADPTKVPTARLIGAITPSEAAELTFYGSEVIHHLTMDQVIKADPPIPIRIKNVKNPRGEGTIVVPDPVFAPGKELRRSRPSDQDCVGRKTPKRPTAVTIKDGISVINVHSNKRSIAHGFFARVFSILDQNQVSVDLISTSEVHVSMAIHSASDNGGNFDRARAELGDCGEVSVLHDMAILSLVGADMKNMVGVAGKMFSTLGEHNVNIEMISQATAMTLASIALPNWISYNITSIKGHSIARNIGLHKTCSSGIDPFLDSTICRSFPIEREDCAGDERGFCSIWRTTGFLMSLAIVVELATLVGFLVIMAGGKMKRVTGWKILSSLLAGIAALLLMSMGTVAYIFDNDDKFSVPGWSLDKSWIMTTISAAFCLLCAAVFPISAHFLPAEGDYEFLRDPVHA
ncbi:hypothetical protein PpBr36_07353 [Pyricularia pennisetigena]|uniref:hypothetical protein n=1 Tax=Pyricularia pennisetigena TaxID=1578925 RepID=UPI00114FF9A9|nr:hypothetical protein PpBr36_07353 [Pyricularia pennisetigena]TLS25071.1 hypothetical protein PpBr36_07353 [Pyricularia pennisetigena]